MTHFFLSSLRARLLLLVLLVIVPALGIILYMAREARLQGSSQAGATTLKLARQTAFQQRRIINQTRDFLSNLVQYHELDHPKAKACPALLVKKLQEHPEYANIFVLALDGDVICSARPLAGKTVNASDRTYFQLAVARKGFSVGEYQIGRVTGKATIAFGYPVLDETGKFTAVLAASLDLSHFSDLIKEAGLPKGSAMLLIDSKGTVLVRHPDPQSFLGKSLTDRSVIRRLLSAKGEELDQEVGLDGIHRLYAFAPIRVGEDTRAYLGVGIPLEVAFADANRALRRNLVLLGIVSLLAFGAAWFGGDLFILRRVNDLVDAAGKLATGDLGARTALPYGKSELDQLARAFDGMAESLQKRQAEIKQAEQALHARHQELQILYQISQTVLTSSNLQTALEKILDEAVAVDSFDLGTILLVDPSGEKIVAAAGRGYRDPANIERRATQGDPRKNLCRTFSYRKTSVVENVRETEGLRTLKREGVQSAVLTPVRAGEKTLGFLQAGSRTRRQFDPDKVRLLEAIGNQIGVAIQKAQLNEDIGRSKKELETTNQFLERSLQQLGALYTAMTPLPVSESLKEMVSGIIERIIETTGADAAMIRVWDKNADTYPIIGQRGFSDDYLKRVSPPPTGGAVDWVIQYGEPIIAADIASEPRLKGKVQLELGLRSCAILPLKVYNEVRGVIQVSSREQGHFDDEQKDHLLAIARQMSIALENRELFENLKASRDQLERANKVKDEFLGVISHELRTPLNVILGYTGLLRDGMFGDLSREQNKALQAVMGQSKDLLSMVNELLQATQIGCGEARVIRTAVNLTVFLDELRMAYDLPTNEELTINWDYPVDLPSVVTDSGKLKEILQNLINNAIKFTEEGTVSITARYLCGAKTMVFKVADTGVGIPKESLSSIFEMFRQVDGSETRPHGGVGLGLYIVKKYTELLGGEVEVKSDLGRGSTFTVTIPCEIEHDTALQEDRSEQTV